MSTPNPTPDAAPHRHARVTGAAKNKDARPRVSFEHLVHKVGRAEDVLEMREHRLVDRYRQLGQVWREGWTPIRIIAVGLASGFLVGRAEPLRALTGARMLQMVGAVSGLFASAQATFAAEHAEQAADSADTSENMTRGQTAAETMAAPSPQQFEYVRPGARTRATPDQVFQTEPRPAEAATEISER
ncbi:MAG: protein sip-5 [Pseudoxanthomonas sp.]